MILFLQNEGNERRQNEKVYTCTHCQKNFSTKGHLKVSNRDCIKCHKIFVNIRRHIQIVIDATLLYFASGTYFGST